MSKISSTDLDLGVESLEQMIKLITEEPITVCSLFDLVEVTHPDLALDAGRLTIWRLTQPDLILLNTEMASLWLRPCRVWPLTERISSPGGR